MQHVRSIISFLILGLITTGVIFRLDENGWGASVWIVAMCVVGMIRRSHEKRNKANKVSFSKQNLTENMLLLGVFSGGWLLPVIHLLTGWLARSNATPPSNAC